MITKRKKGMRAEALLISRRLIGLTHILNDWLLEIGAMSMDADGCYESSESAIEKIKGAIQNEKLRAFIVQAYIELDSLDCVWGAQKLELTLEKFIEAAQPLKNFLEYGEDIL